MKDNEIDQIISSKETFRKFAHSLVYKSFSDRCSKYGVSFDDKFQDMAAKVADYYVDRSWPFTGKYAMHNFRLFLADFNFFGGWDTVEAASRVMPGVETFLRKVEPADEFKRLHGDLFVSEAEEEKLNNEIIENNS